jgi:hypothetical protein
VSAPHPTTGRRKGQEKSAVVVVVSALPSFLTGIVFSPRSYFFSFFAVCWYYDWWWCCRWRWQWWRGW